MLKKTRAAGLIVAAAAGTVLMGTPAFAGDDGGMNNSTELVPVQLCNDNIAAVIGVQVPIGSPQTNGDCVNGSVQED